jgi:hypothetical protein
MVFEVDSLEESYLLYLYRSLILSLFGLILSLFAEFSFFHYSCFSHLAPSEIVEVVQSIRLNKEVYSGDHKNMQ